MQQPKLPALDLYPPFEGFPSEGFRFLRSLKRNNNREWFVKHKQEYEEFVKVPMQSLVAALKQPMAELAPEIVVDPKRSIFRIHRDTRFSKNKAPYKTNTAAVFFPKTRWQESAGFYIDMEPDSVMVGGGIYMPDGNQLKRIRRAIADKPDDFLRTVDSPAFKATFGSLQGERLVRNPMGFDADHRMIEWLKFKQLYTILTWKESAGQSPKLISKMMQTFEKLLPLVRFLNSAMG